jgi:hypothetical protein
MSSAESLGDHRIDRLILIGSPDVTSAVTEQLASRLNGAKLERIDPQSAFISGAAPEGAAAIDLVTIAGAMAGEVHSTVQVVDLINPRKAPEKRDLRRIRILSGSLAGVLLFAGAWFWRQGQIWDLTESKTMFEAKNLEIEEKLKGGKEELTLATRIKDWVDRDIEWLDEMVALQKVLPTTDRVYIDSIQFQTLQQAGRVSVTLQCFAKSDADIEELARRVRDAGYQLEPYKPEHRASVVSGYEVDVVLKLGLPEEPTPASAAVVQTKS